MLDTDRLVGFNGEIDSDALMDALDPVISDAYRLAYGMLRNREEAAEVVQEATFRAWRHRHTYRAGAPIKPWFMAIVANQCRRTIGNRWWSVIRRADVHPAFPDSRDDYTEAQGLRRALLRLSHSDRLVLVLRYYLDLDYNQLAAILRVSPAAVRVRAHRALGRLRPIVEAPEELIDE
ncbi:MAG TPA: RNA polymerase sigma factor [Candidatus Dormibacteraeota bacterium]|jgi:RNA polymerase sigma-70 factor (ECF subfamily)